MRNCFVSYRGGAYSRAGTKFVGQCKQLASGAPPHLIPFQFSVTQGILIEAGDNYFRFASNGAYVLESNFNISAGTNANPGVFTANSNDFAVGDWVYLAGLVGMTSINGIIGIINSIPSMGTFTLASTLTGAPINTTTFGAYVSGGTVARVYTLATPYAAVDLPYLKWVESADVMTLTCYNQITGTEYPPYDLSRITDSDWMLTETTFASSIGPPATITASASSVTTGTLSTNYQYVVTSIDNVTGEESIASPIANVTNSVDIAAQAGSLTITWSGVTGAGSYNIYRAPPAYGATVPIGSLFGYVGTALGLSFVDSNIISDATISPPQHLNPFATSSVTAISMSSFGTGIVAATATVSSMAGTGFVAQGVIIGGEVQWWVVEDGGEGYSTSDAFNISATYTSSGSTSSASGTLIVGPSTGTYPGTAAYFQQRRYYANTLNDPDTYFASQPGAFLNFDTSNPVQDDDSIIGTPWAQQVNGIQAMVPMPNGLVILTGLGAWQLSGGATQTAVTPSDQVAVPQAYNGCAPTIRPLTINYDIIYVQERGSNVRDLAYNFFVNIYTGTDMTVLSNHLFEGFQIVRWDWAEEPFKLVWAVRNDGTVLCLAYLKEQDVYAWSRHDTNGLFQSVAVVSEPPVNAPYFVVKRLIQNDGNPVWAYYLERMDNRLWENAEEPWCVDAGLSYAMPTPNAMLNASSASGVATLQQPTVAYGGTRYGSATYARVNDPTGQGAVCSLTIAGGVITAATVSGTLADYTNPTITVIDPAVPATDNEGNILHDSSGNILYLDPGLGGGAVINIISLNIVTFTASAPVFTNANVGNVIRMGGGIATIITVTSPTTAIASMTQPIAQTIQNDPLNTPIPTASGDWTMTAPTTTVQGLNHLEGMSVAILADGYVPGNQTVTNGTITLQSPASAITIGLPYLPQVQTLYAEVPGAVTGQTRRKNIPNMSVRLEKSRGVEVGVNQPDQAVQPNFATVPWKNMAAIPQSWGSTLPGTPPILATGDMFADLFTSYDPRGQVAFQQPNPLPMQVSAVVSWINVGDDPG